MFTATRNRRVLLILVFAALCPLSATPVLAVVTNPNLALNKTVTSSSSLEGGGWGRAKLVDGIKTSPASSYGWMSNSNTTVNHTEWVKVDLGATYNVSEIVLYPINSVGQGMPVDFTVQVSTDDSTWTPVSTKVNNPNLGYPPKIITFASASARYVRIHATSLQLIGGTSYHMQFAELEVRRYNQVSPYNLAYAKTVTASSSNETNNFGATALVDGIQTVNPQSQGYASTSSTGSNHTEWVQVDLGSIYSLGEIILHAGKDLVGFPLDFTIQVSTGAGWTTIVSRSGVAEPGYVRQAFLVDGVQAQFVKVTGTSLRNIAGSGYVMRLGELEIFGDQKNLAHRKYVSASSSFEDGLWSTMHAVDGIKESVAASYGWSSSDNYTVNHTEWVQIDLTQSYGVGQVVLYPLNAQGQGFPLNFTIQVSTNGANWSTVVTRTNYANPGSTPQSFTFTNTSARYVKVHATSLRSTAGSYYMQLAEIGVFRNTSYADTRTVDYTMETVVGSSAPLISINHPGSSNNAYGYETGHVIKLANGEYRMAVTELWDVNNPWEPARNGLWKSTDGTTWTRLSTLNQGNDVAGDPHEYLWDPMYYYNTAEGRWNITYRGNVTVFRAYSSVNGTNGVDGPYIESPNTLTPFLGSRKYWQHSETPAAFSNVFTVGSKLYAFITDGYSNWTAGLVSADSITGPWTQDNSKEIADLQYAENPIVEQLDDGTYIAVFDEINNGDKNLSFAYSLDGIHWIQKNFNLEASWVDTNGPVNSMRTPLSLIRESNGLYTVYFTAKNVAYGYWEIGKISVRVNTFTNGHAVTTSSTYDNSWTAANVGDANAATGWSSVLQAAQTGSQWIFIDKGTTTTITGVKLRPRTSGGLVYCFPLDFKFQHSADGQNWTDVPGQTYTNYANPANAEVTFAFGSALNTRYVRMLATKFRADGASNYYMQLAEFKTY